MVPFKLSFFGQPRLEQNGKPLQIRSRKGLALVAYLAATDAPQSRDVLAGLLWPEYDQTRARANLRRTLYNLNQTPIADWLFAEQESIALPRNESVQVDIQRFSNLLSQATPDSSNANQLEDAVRLYAADFLNGFYLRDSEPFGEWALIQREKYRRQVIEALEHLATLYLTGQDFGAAEQAARRQLEVDNLRESAWRQLMTALASDGRRAQAMAAYEQCRQLLMEELGVEPAVETVALADALRNTREKEDGKKGGPGTEKRGDLSTGLQAVPADEILAPAQCEKSQLSIASPYRGLHAFREEDAALFFGRESYTELLLSAVFEQSIVALIGPSGSGKSSVIYAGLVADLRPAVNWVIISMRPGQRPFHALAAAFLPYLEGDQSETERLLETGRLAEALINGSISCQDIVQRILEKHHSERVLLLLDQFEELFTLVPDGATQQHFLDTLLELVFDQQFRPSPIYTLVLTLRADFLGQALAHRSFADAIQESDVKLGSMSRQELSRAVSLPAQAAGATFEAGLVARILDDVGEEPGSLPLLEFALTGLWEEAQHGELTHTAYETIGRVDGGLARYADSVLASLVPLQQLQARRIFIQLVSPGVGTEDTRRIATRAELGDDWALVPELAGGRLLVTGRDPAGQETAELVHEALIQRWDQLREWMAQDRTFRIWQERLRVAMGEWEAHERDQSALLRGVALATAEQWHLERPEEFGDDEGAFIAASILQREEQASEKQQAQAERERLQRRFISALSVGLALALLLAVAALLQWRTASNERDAAQQAFALQLAAQSENAQDDQLDLALLLAVEAVRQNDTTQTRAALSEALGHSPNLQQFIRVPETAVYQPRGGLSPNGRFLAQGSESEIRVWNTATGEQVGPVIQSENSGSRKTNIAFSNDGLYLATIGKRIELIDAASGEIIHSIGRAVTEPGHPGAQGLLFSPDSRLLASISVGRIVLWDVQTGEAIQRLVGGSQPSVAFRHDGRVIAAGGSVSILIWDVSSGERIITLPAHNTVFSQVAFSPDGRFLAAGGEDGSVRFWDGETFEELSGAIPAHDGPVRALTFAPDSRSLASGGEDGTIRNWLTATLEQSSSFSGHQGAVFDLSYSADGGTLISAAMTQTEDALSPQLIEWKVDDVAVIPLIGYGSDVIGVALNEQKGTITSVDTAGNIRRWSQDGRFLSSPASIPKDGSEWAEAISADGRYLARAMEEGPVHLYDTDDGTILLTLDEPYLPVAGLEFTADGRYLIGGGCGEGTLSLRRCDNAQAWVWEVATGELAATTQFPVPEAAFNEVAISPDGRLAAAGIIPFDPDPQRLAVWEVAGGELLSEKQAKEVGSDSAYGLAFSPDGRFLSGNGPDGFTLWEIAEGAQLLQRFVWADAPDVTIAAFSGDGRYLAAGTTSGAINLWEVANGTTVTRLETVHTEPITDLAFSPNGQLLISAGEDNTISRIDLAQLLAQSQSAEMMPLVEACRRANRNLTDVEWRRYFGDEPYRESCPGDQGQ